MSVYAFNYLRNGEYSNLFTVATFSSLQQLFVVKTSLPVKNPYLLIFFDDKTKTLAVCLNCIERSFAQFCY